MKYGHIVIVGAGQAGGRAAETLRLEGFAGAVTVIGDEPEIPYERPALSKGVLTGQEPSAATYLNPREFYAANNIDLHLATRVEAVAPARSEVMLADGRSIAYTKLLFCTGSRVRALPDSGHLSAGIHYLRTIKDCETLRNELRPGKRLVAIGGGFIGLELASSAVKLGLTATVVEQKASLLDRVVPREIASRFESLHIGAGVDVRLNARVVALHGRARVESVELADGSMLPADVVVVGIGVIPNSGIAQAAGVACSDGIVVDEYGATNLPDVYAAGDVTNHPNPILGKRLRLESWQNAQNQAIAVARNMLGRATGYSEVPWFWSDQLGQNFQLLGVPEPTAQVVWRGDRDARQWMAFTLESGRLTSALAFNGGNELRFARRLIELRSEIEAETLRDTSNSLKDVMARAVRTTRHDVVGTQ